MGYSSHKVSYLRIGYLESVLRIHLILMRIWILDKIYWICLTKNNFQIFGFIFFAYFYPKTIQKWGNFYILPVFNSSDLGFRRKEVIFAAFGWYFTPWIRIQEAKILRIQRIRILSTAVKACILRESGRH